MIDRIKLLLYLFSSKDYFYTGNLEWTYVKDGYMSLSLAHYDPFLIKNKNQKKFILHYFKDQKLIYDEIFDSGVTGKIDFNFIARNKYINKI